VNVEVFAGKESAAGSAVRILECHNKGRSGARCEGGGGTYSVGLLGD